LDSIKYNKAIFRISDKISGFPRFTPAMLRLEKEIARRVDLVVYSAKSLESYVNALKPKCSLHLPNGVNFDHFAYGSKEMPPEYHTITKPIAIYVGSMEVWFDFDLVNYCARMLPYLSFVLIGPNKLARQHLDFLPNIYLLGSKKYRDLPSYLHNADVGIIPFDVKGHADLVHNVNPLKLYEYMACGLPVVSVGWEEISNLASPAILCDNPEAFVQGIKTTLLQSKRREPYIQYASRHTWSKRIYQMQEYLGTLL
jgi:glycosyltransferase involved in cell wall biosynthesis